MLGLLGVDGWLDDRRYGRLSGVLAVLLGLAGSAIGFATCSAAATSALVLMLRGEPVGVRAAIARLGRRAWSTIGASLGVGALCVVIGLTVIGIPLAIWLGVRWLFVQDAMLARDLGARDALRWSRTIVRGHWWRTFGCSTLLAAIAIASGPLVGIAMIFFTSLPLSLVERVRLDHLRPCRALARDRPVPALPRPGRAGGGVAAGGGLYGRLISEARTAALASGPRLKATTPRPSAPSASVGSPTRLATRRESTNGAGKVLAADG